MKHLTATFEVGNDMEEHSLRIHLEGIGARYVKTLPDSTHLKEDEKYKELYRQKKQAEKNLYNYIDSIRNV
jgi:hypothetical protein